MKVISRNQSDNQSVFSYFKVKCISCIILFSKSCCPSSIVLEKRKGFYKITCILVYIVLLYSIYYI